MIEKTSISSRNLDFSSRKVLERKRKNMLNTKEWELLNDLVAELYGIGNAAAMRKAFLTRLMALIQFDLADFNLAKDDRPSRHPLTDPVVVSIFDKEKEEAFLREYETKYYEIDYVSWLFAYHESLAYRESDLIDAKIRKGSQFYREYLSKFDLSSVAGVVVISAGRLMGAVTLYKSERKGDFSQRDLYILERLLPHLQNVLNSDKEKHSKDKEAVDRLLKYHYGITTKERAVIELICQGLSTEEIARRRHVSPNTVKCHISNIFNKTEVKSRTQLISLFLRKGFLEYLGRS